MVKGTSHNHYTYEYCCSETRMQYVLNCLKSHHKSKAWSIYDAKPSSSLSYSKDVVFGSSYVQQNIMCQVETLINYTNSVLRLMKFAEEKNYTRKQMLPGIKCWHLFHDKEYPQYNPLKLKVLLKCSKIAEAALRESEKEQKKPVVLWHLVQLMRKLTNGSQRDQVALTIALVALLGRQRYQGLNSSIQRKDSKTRTNTIPEAKMPTIVFRPNKRNITNAMW